MTAAQPLHRFGKTSTRVLPRTTATLASRRSRRHNTGRLRLSSMEQLETRCCLAAVAFAPHDVVFAINSPSSVYAGDVDGDGDVDLLSASSAQFDPKIAWFENTDGQGKFGNPRVITTAAHGAFSVYAGDVDGDGDLDALSASSYGTDNKIAWYENTDGKGAFGAQRVITTLADGVVSMYAGDVDGDGDLDMLSASRIDRKIAWYENTDGRGTFGAQRLIISTTGSIGFSWTMHAGDVDGDGDLDVLSASASAGDSKVAWYENTDGKGTFGNPRFITTAAAFIARSVYSNDVDGDGDLDVLTASGTDQKFAWYENVDGKGTFGAQRVITTSVGEVVSMYAGDVDGDGDLDVLAAASVFIAWYENTDAKGTFGDERVVATTALSWPKSVSSGDVDGDGDFDVLSASYYDDKIAWYENTDGKGTFGKQRVITTSAKGAQSVSAGDLDGDGDLDVLSASGVFGDDGTIAWYENMDSKGTFGEQPVITTAVSQAESVYVGDVDGDGDLDVLSASYDKIAWYENMDAKGTFGTQRVITTSASRRSVYAGDVDGDGDLDVLFPSRDRIVWYENTDGKGTFGNERVITAAASDVRSVYVEDVDGDGDVDVLSASYYDDKIAWYENTDGKGNFGNQRLITSAADGARSVYAGDVDGDGDVDVLSASYYVAPGSKVAWYENTDGKGTFGDQRVISTEALGANSVYAVDLDGDGDLDVLSASRYDNELNWYENLSDPPGRTIGDANGDGIFNSSDLNVVFQAGEYEDGVPQNSTFEEGDWNDDHEFDSGDLVRAFQAGTYVNAAQRISDPIAAADWLFANGTTSRKSKAFLA